MACGLARRISALLHTDILMRHCRWAQPEQAAAAARRFLFFAADICHQHLLVINFITEKKRRDY